MVAVSRIEVNHDGYGGTAPTAMVWDNGSILEPRSSALWVVDHASCPGHLVLETTLGVVRPVLPSLRKMSLSGPYGVNILLEFTTFLASLHWPQGGAAYLEKFGTFLFLHY